MRKKSIVTTSVVRLTILGLAILISVSIVTGIQFYNKMSSEYQEIASTFFKIVTYEVDSDLINQMVDRKDEFANIDDFIQKYSEGNNQNMDKDTQKLYNKWLQTDWLLYETVSYNKNFITFQILIPDGDGAICLWTEKSNDKPKQPIQRKELSYREKAYIDSVYGKDKEENNGNDNGFFLVNFDTQMIGTVINPIYDENGEAIAIAELDLDLSQIIYAILKLILLISVLTIFIIAFALELYFYFTRREILYPIQKLEKETKNVADRIKNDEEIKPIEIHTNDEIESLAHSFESMEANLRTMFKENIAITSEQEHIKAELDLASTIQTDMLNKDFPPFPERNEFHIYASMTPAKEVGGDFYDYFLIDENHLALVIADVSGKGVPAALFMMRTMLMIKSLATSTLSPSKILGSLNNMLHENNKGRMFVTIWLGILDIENGILRASNAGHEFPFIKRPGGEFEVYKDKHGFIVGGKSNLTYKEYQLELEPGTKLFLYTDGLPEAKNVNNEMFRIDASIDALNEDANANVEELITNVKAKVMDFMKDAEQFDDLTMLSFEYNGVDKDKNVKIPKISVEADVDNVSGVIEYLGNTLDEIGCDAKAIKHIKLATEEIIVNIANYAYYGYDYNPDKPCVIIVSGRVNTELGEATIIIRDNGIPFNPLAKKDPNTTLKAKERKAGGLGIFLTKKFMDNVQYEYNNNQNILILTKKI